MVISDFSFARTPRIYFAPGKFNELDKILNNFGKTVLLVTGANSLKTSGRLDVLLKTLKQNSINYFTCSVAGEPSPEFIDSIVADFRNKKIDVVLAIGGGSVVDTGKAISAMFTQKDSVLEYLEGVGTKIHNGIKLPFIAVPTTSGTGSEATKNAVLSRIGIDGFKKSLRHDNFVPDVALIDPELMLSCPPDITAACGMDAFTQLLESYISPQSSPMTDALAYIGIKYIKDSIIPACNEGADNIQVRADMAFASLISGITLANAGLGIVHGFASSIGGFFDIPHGVICGSLIGKATKTNIECLKNENSWDNLVLKKYAAIGRLVSNNNSQDVEYCCRLLVEKINEWIEQLKIPLLNKYNMKKTDIDKIISKTGNKNNPVELDINSKRRILLDRI